MRILVVDDHHLVREGVRPLLGRLAEAGEAIEVLEAATFREGLVQVKRHPDIELVLLDLRLPDVAGFDALVELQREHPEVPVVVMSGEDDAASVREALERGALGYIPKSSSPEVIVHALRLVLSGGTYVPPEIMGGAAQAAPRTTGATNAARLGLTARQGEVLALLVAGKSNKQICRELGLAEGTVKSHLAAIFKALGVATRVQAVIAAGKLGVKG
ncbi:MAG TPA: response regulator transcription factor [Usitatibacter sp.]|nr:response regulator transcription factor [Usitatibacter sp.]